MALLGYEALSWTEGLFLSHILACVASAYCYYLVTILPLGLPRFIATIPVLALYACLPFIFNRSTHLIGLMSLYCILTWIASFKLLLLCYDQGPGSEPWVTSSFPRFAIVMTYPAHVRRTRMTVKKVAAGRWSWYEMVAKSEVWYVLVFRSVVKVLVLAVLLRVLLWRESLPRMILHLLLSLQLYLFATIVLEVLAAVANALFGVTIEPHFDNPFAASSLAEFWGRRWNLLVSNSLRETVYNPVLALMESAPQSQKSDSGDGTGVSESARDLGLRQRVNRSSSESQAVVEEEYKLRNRFDLPKPVATLAAFLVSGLCHELMVYYATLEVTWEMMSFFVVQGVAVALEGALKLYRPERRRLPRVVSTLLTLGFAFLTAHWLFWPPLAGITEQVAVEMRNMCFS